MSFDERLRVALFILAVIGCILAGAVIYHHGRPPCPATVHSHGGS